MVGVHSVTPAQRALASVNPPVVQAPAMIELADVTVCAGVTGMLVSGVWLVLDYWSLSQARKRDAARRWGAE